MLWLFFFLFCGLVAVAGFAGWRYYSDAMAPLTAQVRVYASGGVLLQEHDNAPSFIPKDICGAVPIPEPRPDLPPLCADITEGFRVEAIPQMGYGQVASIVFSDESQIDMWAHPTGADITLPVARASRWTDQRRTIELDQSAGYARYDIKDGRPYRESSVVVRISESVWVELEPEGSYSVNVPREPQDGQLRSALARTRSALLAEVAVRNSGRATLWSGGRSRVVDPGQKAAVESDGALQPATPAGWQLIADGGFAQGDPSSAPAAGAAWEISGGPLAPDLRPEELNGVFRVVRQCPPTKVDYCQPSDQIQIGQFRRDGNQPKPYVTRIKQLLDTDISEYRGLRFTAWVRVLTQTVPLAGVNQGECPLFLRLGYKHTTPNDQLQERQICVYTASESTGLAGTEVGGVLYQQVPPYNWYQIDLDLRNDPQIRTVRYLESITIEARGHDYLSQITAISLIGEQ
ncbi:MAG TPA: hypothetical protein VFS21_18280 [Roseiflexaceae bacterium]|nr:hypothetical protein [Roseiflexaceae bacterium]